MKNEKGKKKSVPGALRYLFNMMLFNAVKVVSWNFSKVSDADTESH